MVWYPSDARVCTAIAIAIAIAIEYVLAIAGEEHVLSARDVDEKLRAGTVLALFKPGRALLDAVCADADPPVDAASVELADGAPLLVYSAGGVVHIDADNGDGPSEYKLRELVQNGGAAGGGPTAGLFGSMMGGVLRGRRLPY
ncbi:hypothetical protein EYR40_008503 [Pleurotus pulmonarius]|nr:hypothetical protein EYR36_009321 [Pleurotus pulmonarius]KAF4592820.1 hypothetical protein EYR38_008522 [Pleurotus pulmonarius]KAF4593713.1 hypothetical protein EYR40_008503 [Pleurotus pulmonarius]